MFGYVIPNQAALDDEAKARYRTAYCGLCRRIGALHGLRGRLTLSYDLTFLDLLLSSLYEGESECVTGSGHCPIHPIRKINWRHSGPTDYCADMSVALHYYNAADKWNDDHSLLGLGFGRGRQKYLYLPEEHNDYIFAIACEELGFVGAIGILILFALLIIRGYWIAMHARDRFSMLLAAGLTTLLALQVFLNVAVVTNLLPSTGISLPFFSYGGTALIMQLAENGIVLNVSRSITQSPR